MTRKLALVLILAAFAAFNAVSESNNPPKAPDSQPQTKASPDPTGDPGVRKLSRRERKERLKNLAEKYRQFLREVEPIMVATELHTFLVLESDGQRDLYIEEFWNRRDPDPKRAGNEYREGYTARLTEAKDKYKNLSSDRAKIFLVRGEPVDRKIIDTCRWVQPIEIWQYTFTANMGRDAYLIFYRPRTGIEYRIFDASFMSTATSTGSRMGDPLEELLSPDGQQRGTLEVFYGMPPGRDTVGRSQTPLLEMCDNGDFLLRAVRWSEQNRLAVSEAFEPPKVNVESVGKILRATVIADPNAPLLTAEWSAAFPGKRGGKTATEMTILVERSQLISKDLENGKFYNFDVTGEILKDDKIYETFRYRYDFPAEVAPEKLPLIVERFLYPAEYQSRVKVTDINSNRQVIFERPLSVPHMSETAEHKTQVAEATDALDRIQAETRRGQSTLRIIPPPGEFHTGFHNIDTLITGDTIKAVEFYLDGKKVMTKRIPPYTLELDFGAVPQTRRVKAVGLDSSGKIVSGDDVVLNTGTDPFRVRIASPRIATNIKGPTRVEIDADPPEGKKIERVELFLNETKVTTLYDAPYVQTIDIPVSAGIGYLRAVAWVNDEDIQPIEDVVFINSPEFLQEIEVHLVELPTTVISSGRFVTGLTQNAFEILDEGKPVKVSKFEFVKNLPLSIGLAIDTSESMRVKIMEAQKGAAQFFKNVLRPGDKAFVVSFDDQPITVQKWTRSLASLNAGLASLRAEDTTALYDAIVYSLYHFQGVKGQRALILLSDGEDTASRFTYDQTLDYARRSGIPIYSIAMGIKPTQQDIRFKLSRLASETGGAVHYIDTAADLLRIYDQIQMELRSQYLIGFYPPEGVKPGSKWRQVAVLVKNGKAKTIRGYYP